MESGDLDSSTSAYNQAFSNHEKMITSTVYTCTCRQTQRHMSTDATVVIRQKSIESTCQQMLRDLSIDVTDRNARVLCFGKTDSACRQIGPYGLPQDEDTWTKDQIAKGTLNWSALNMMQCAVHPKEYSRVSTCTSAKEMWDKLELIYEGASEVRESKSAQQEGSESETSTDSENDEMAMLTRQFKKFLKFKRRGSGNSKPFQKGTNRFDSSNKKYDVVCYECKKQGHMRRVPRAQEETEK
ncbi:hypothetical protein Taro_037998 [Colocasia esculenta]|uniref:Uncharacterized protein n=1 Tax=Colocasia esculenta TaxID=4460 RepID=A0A843WEI0_COLES|nr:hypothetical protein [Colocasia esculenta]